ncbi:Probable disease resistance protein RPP1 [Linum perenne]
MQGENLVLTNKELKKLTRLRYFDLSNGRLAGNFKDVLPNIRWLGLCNCNSVPVGLNLEKLVILRLKDCSVSDGWKGWQELKGELDIRNFKNLRFLGISETKIIKLKGEIGSLQNLQELDASHSSLIEVPTGISKLSSLEYLDLTLTHPNKTNFTEMLPKSLKILAISSSSLSALPSSLTYLKSCYCEHLPNLANLTNLSKLVLMDTEIGEILGLGELKLLEFLNIERAPNLVNLDGLDNLVLLKKLSVEGCPVLDKLPSLAALTRGTDGQRSYVIDDSVILASRNQFQRVDDEEILASRPSRRTPVQ